MTLPEGYIPVLNHGFVALLDSMGNDLTVVNSARVSFGKRHPEMEEGDAQLINYLLSHRHGTPFESILFQLHVKCPIFVMREWIRHRVSSFNEYSMRYTEAPEEWYYPELDAIRVQVGKPGHYTYEPAETGLAERTQRRISATCYAAFQAYKEMLDAGIAKELARVVLPVAMYTEFYWTINARSLMNFLNLRNALTAQREIREYAEVIDGLFATVAPITAQAFIDNGRVAP